MLIIKRVNNASSEKRRSSLMSSKRVTLSVLSNMTTREVNNKGKVRRANKSLVLGKAKIISYKDLEEVRVKCAINNIAIVKGKVIYSRKRKSYTIINNRLDLFTKAT